MKGSCPRCGRATTLDDETGDFPTRCTRCGALVRKRTEGESNADDASPPSTRIEQGMLAGMLIARRVPPPPRIIHANPALAATVQAPTNQGILRPESRREIFRARSRQQALVKAKLRGSQQALGALTWAGLALVALLALGALSLKAHAMWAHPVPLRADVLKVTG